MAEDALAFRFFDRDEMKFVTDDAAVRDAAMKLMNEVGYNAAIEEFGASKGGEAEAVSKMTGLDSDDPFALNAPDFNEGGDFFLF